MADSNREEIAKLEAIYANNPGGRVFTHLAEAYRKAGELERARSILDAGLARHPDYSSAHVVLGRVLLDQNQPEHAATSFQRVLDLDPENRVALRTLGDLSRSDQPERALGHYRQLQMLDPSDEDLSRLIDRLTDEVAAGQPPVAETPAAEEEPLPWLEEPAWADPAAAAPAEPEPWVAEAPVFEAESIELPVPDQPALRHVTEDFTIDWSAAEPDTEDALPGDLADLARLQQEEQSAQEEQPAPWTPEAVEEDPLAGLIDEVWAAPAEPAAEPVEREPEPEAEPEPWAAPVEEPLVEPEPWAALTGDPPAEAIEENPFLSPAAETPLAEEEAPMGEGDVEAEPAFDLAPLSPADAGPPFPAGEPLDAAAMFADFEGLETIDAEPAETFRFPDLEMASEAPAPAMAEPEPSGTTFESMLSTGADAMAGLDPNESDLPTETLAELYRSQGFYERAADVYRSLLQRIPGDARLEQKLEDVEGLQRSFDAALASETTPAAPALEPAEPVPAEPEPAPAEAWLQGVESAWTGGAGAADTTNLPFAWELESDEATAGDSLRNYMSGLLSWRPAVPEPEPAPAPAPIHEAPAEPVFETTPVEAAAPWEMELPDKPAAAPPVAAAPESAAGESSGFWTPDDDILAPAAELFPEAAPPVVQPDASAEAAARPAPARPVSVDDAFEEWFGDVTGVEVGKGTAAGAPDFGAADSTVPAENASSAEEDADDDLEMFRSWLQSLKR